jgi:hypothetical protein
MAESATEVIERMRRSNRRWKVLAIGSWAILGLAVVFAFTSAQLLWRQAEAARHEAELARHQAEENFNRARQAVDKWLEEAGKVEQPK